MGKFTYLRSRYYVPYEYSHYIQYKNKNVYKYILFKLLSILLEEMFYSVKCYRLTNRKYKHRYIINMNYLSTVQLFIHKFFNFIYCSEFVIDHSLPNRINTTFLSKFFSNSGKNKAFRVCNSDLPNLTKRKNLLYTSLKQYSMFQINNSSYILFVKLLLLLLFRRDMISFSAVHARNIIYRIRQISNYIFFDRYKEVIFSISQDILSYDLRKLIISSVFSIRRYANRQRFLNKKPILNKISFLMILSIKRFDKLKRSKLNRTFYSYKLQFKQIFKNIYNFKTTKKFNQYIKKINSKLVHNVNTYKLHMYQIHAFINDNFFFHKSVNKPETITINNHLNKNINKHHHFLIGDQVEIFYNTYKYIYSIRKLYIGFLISQLFYNCCSNFFFIKMRRSKRPTLLFSKNTPIRNINLYKYCNYMHNYITFLNRDLSDVNIQNNQETNTQRCSIIDFKKKIIRIKEHRVEHNFMQTNKIIKLKKIKAYYKHLFKNKLIEKTFNLFNIPVYKYYTRKKRYKKLIYLCKKYIIKSTKITDKQLLYLIFKKLKNIKNGIHMYKRGTYKYSRLLYQIHSALNVYPKKSGRKNSKKIFNKNNNYHYHFVWNNNTKMHNYAKQDSFSGLHILIPMLVVYKYHTNSIRRVLDMKIKTEYDFDFHMQYCEFTQLLQIFISSHLNYISSISKYNRDSNLDFQINYSILKQLSSNIYKNFLVTLFMKLSNSVFTLFFIFNSVKKFQIDSFLICQSDTLDFSFIDNMNSILNSSCLSKGSKINNFKDITQQIRLLKLFNLNSTDDYLSKIYYFLCNYLISEILSLIKNPKNNYIHGLKSTYTNNKFIKESIVNKSKLLPRAINIANTYYATKLLYISHILFKSITHFRKLFNTKKHSFIIFRQKQQFQKEKEEDYPLHISGLKEYELQEAYIHTSSIIEISAELISRKQKKDINNLYQELTTHEVLSLKLFNYKRNNFSINTILSSINNRNVFYLLNTFFYPQSIYRIGKKKKYFYLINKIKTFKPSILYNNNVQDFRSYYLLQAPNKYFQYRQYHVTTPLLAFDFKLALKEIKVNKPKSITDPEYDDKIEYTESLINKLVGSYKKSKDLLKITIFDTNFKSFIRQFKTTIKARYKKRIFNKNLNLRKKFVRKYIIITKLYFEYLDKLDLCLNIKVSITLFTLLNNILNLIISMKSLDSVGSKLFKYKMQGRSINKLHRQNLNSIFDNFLMTYYYNMCLSLGMNVGDAYKQNLTSPIYKKEIPLPDFSFENIINVNKSTINQNQTKSSLPNFSFKNTAYKSSTNQNRQRFPLPSFNFRNTAGKHSRPRSSTNQPIAPLPIDFDFRNTVGKSTINKRFFIALPNYKYTINKSFSKIPLNKRYSSFSLPIKLNNFILQYNYLRYLKQCLTRVIITPLCYKLTISISNSISNVSQINNIKEYLQFRTQYINNLRIIFRLDSYLYIVRENKLRFILYSDPYFASETNKKFSEIELTKFATDIRYLFDEKNYRSITTKYR